ncbi:MAG TPA: 6-phosphogluconolactonase [Longimicrobiaceae bacterium]
MIPNVGRIVVHDDALDLARAVAEEFVTRSTRAVRERGRFAVALTGGSSPVEAYRLLGEAGFADRIPWRDVHLFWGDDRVVPAAHPRSNFGLAHRLFIGRVPIPPANVHRVRGELNAARAAERYERELHDFFAGPVRFDLIHLGLGDDGHVASLFPFDRERLLERERPVVASLLRELGEWRVSLTLPVLNAGRRVEFLLPSATKARIARSAMRGPIDPVRMPAQGVIPGDGDLVWRLTREMESACEALAPRD